VSFHDILVNSVFDSRGVGTSETSHLVLPSDDTAIHIFVLTNEKTKSTQSEVNLLERNAVTMTNTSHLYCLKYLNEFYTDKNWHKLISCRELPHKPIQVRTKRVQGFV